MAPRVVVVGAGLVGSEIIAKLQESKEIELTVVDRRDYFENNIGSVRSVVDKSFWTSTVISHSRWMKPSVRFVLGICSRIEEKQIEVTKPDGQTEMVGFDYLVVATGSSYPLFKAEEVTIADREARINELNNQIAQAQHIILLGGGPVGVELAGEIKFVHPNKKLTLITSADVLLKGNPASAHPKTLATLQGMGVEVILNDRLVENKDAKEDEEKKGGLVMRQYTTRAGVKLEADLVLRCVGATPASEPFRANFSQCLSERGYVKCNTNLQMQGFPNIFVCGDLTDFPKARLVANTKVHTDIICTNLLNLVRNRPVSETYDPSAGMEWAPAVSFGPSVGLFSGPCCGGCTCMAGCWGSMKSGFMTKHPNPSA